MQNKLDEAQFVNSIFFRPKAGKCPKCGSFAADHEHGSECGACSTVFNDYVVWEVGDDLKFENN